MNIVDLYSLLDVSVQSCVLRYVGALLCFACFRLYLCFRLVQQFSTL